MGQRGFAAIAGALTCAAMLCGCAPTSREIPPGPTAEEIAAAEDARQDTSWRYSFPDGTFLQQPDVEVVRVVTGAEWEQTMSDCYHDNGVDDGRALFDGVAPLGVGSIEQQMFAYTQHVCTFQYPVEEWQSPILSGKQIAYQYDYWVTHTAPCLQLMGYKVIGIPTRQQYVDSFYSGEYWWSPYQAMPWESDIDWDLVDFRCPPLPIEPFGPFHPGQYEEAEARRADDN